MDFHLENYPYILGDAAVEFFATSELHLVGNISLLQVF